MGREIDGEAAARLDGLARRIEHWRAARKASQPMPGEIWDAAVALAREHGVGPVARALRIDFGALKKRLGDSTHVAATRSTHFVELDDIPVFGRAVSTPTVVELCAADGATLVIRLAARDAVDVTALAAAFWRRGA